MHFVIPKRYFVSALAFLGFMVMFYLRTNLSIAIVAMTDGKNITVNNKTYFQKAEFDWNSKEKGFILGSFSYGYFLAPLGGFLANKFGGATVFGLGLLMTAILTILSPIFFRLNFYVFITARICEGAFEAFSMASSAELFARWSPPAERARLIMYSHSGVFFGSALNYPISAFIAHRFGWEAIFYFSGAVSLIWYVFWALFVSNDPASDKFITNSEKLYLKEKITYMGSEKVIYPWKRMLMSKSIYAYIIHKFAHAWSFAFTVFCLPWYFKDLYEVNINEIGLVSSIPNICTIVSQPIAATLADYFKSKKILTSTQIHKLFTCGSYFFAVILFIVVQSWSKFIGSIICFSIFRFTVGFSETSYNIMPLDIAPRYASFISGVGSAFYSLGTLLSPLLMGYIVTEHKQSQWNTFFSLLSGINFCGGTLFFLLVSGELQPWAISQKAEKDETKKEISMQLN
ncbi:hypothetical protein PGB90_003505 [Kerria lacca]